MLATVLAGVAATSYMTLFSYHLSRSKRKQFREPELLERVIGDLWPGLRGDAARASAWVIHYAVGVAFAATYECTHPPVNGKAALIRGAAFGAACGLLAIGVWHLTFKLTSRKAELRSYYAQLFAAHVIFGITDALVAAVARKH